MGISRAAQSPTLVHRSFKATCLNRRDVNQVRNLWWWTQKRRGWLSLEHDDMEEKLRRHQALMMHRYSKSMRRRSLWDRDDSPKSPSWRMRGCNWGRGMSSTKPQSAKVEDQDTNDRRKRQTWQEFHKDFESFKRAVDKAIERDPVGTLFGRRLRSPDTPNNSAWTSWSWIFDPKEIKEEPQAAPGDAQKPSKPTDTNKTTPTSEAPNASSPRAPEPAPSVLHTSSSGITVTSLRSSKSEIHQIPASAGVEYIYDPISGRKVPQSALGLPSSLLQADHNPAPAQADSQRAVPPSVASQMSSTPPQSQERPTPAPSNKTSHQDKPVSHRGYVESMFTEHGVDIPVKVYKPRNVYEYTGEPKPAAPEKKPKIGFESTRKREYDQLRLRTIGNNIDATNFNCEPWNNRQPEPPKVEEPSEPSEPPEKRLRTSPAPSEDAPLFSGTTYQSNAAGPSPSKSDWLAKEGFRSRQGLTIPFLKEDTLQPAPREHAEKMEPVLNRRSVSGTEIPVKKFGSKLQPAMDRIVCSAKSEPTPSKPIPMQAPTPKKAHAQVPTEEAKEDLDLLTASDVRAAAKAARVTKQEVEDKKKEDRTVLEQDFKARQQTVRDLANPSTTTSTSFSTSVGMDKIAKHIKQYPDGIVAKTMKNIGVVTGTPKEGIKVPRPVASTTMTKPVSESNATIKALDAEGRQFVKLASDLKDIYRQSIPEEELQARLRLAQPKETGHKPSFSHPTVKLGVARDLSIERHTKDFEPKVANIVDKAKSVKRELHGVRLGLGDVINERAITALANKDLIARVPVPASIVAKVDQQLAPTQNTSASTPIPTTNTYSSPYVLLIYKQALGDVEVEPLDNLMGRSSSPEAKTNPMAAIGSLKDPNAFVKHFADLDKNGYELISGGGDMMIFRKRHSKPNQASSPSTTLGPTSTSELRSTIAAAEAAAQPTSKETADMPAELPGTGSTPSLAAPTAPSPSKSRSSPSPSEPPVSASKSADIPISPTPKSKQDTSSVTSTPPESESQPEHALRLRRSRSKVNRQEQVFSGQVRLPQQKTALPDPEHFQKQNPAATHDPSAFSYASSEHERPYTGASSSSTPSQPGFFARLRRGVRRVILTAIAFGAGAYGIGVVAEGVNAKAQLDGAVGGPMKRIVMESEDSRQRDRQRSGIFSTESSR